MSMNYQERENLEVGQKVYLFYPGWGRNKGRYSRPLEVIKVTKTQFTVEAEGDGKPKRFMKSNGTEVGRGYGRSSIHVSLVTSKTTKEVNEYNREVKAEENAAQSAARQAEIKLRKKYGANKILADDIQDKYLKPLRHQMEIGEGIMKEFLEKFQGVTVEDENFWRVSDAVQREAENGKWEYALNIRDKAQALHEDLVNMVIHFQHGTRYKIGEQETFSITELLEARVRQTLGQQMDKFFNYTFGHNRDMTEADQKFITVLREMLNDEERRDRVRVIDPEENAA